MLNVPLKKVVVDPASVGPSMPNIIGLYLVLAYIPVVGK